MRIAFGFVLIVLPAFTSQVKADQSAKMVCINNPCDRYELLINITSDGDAGLPGAYGVIAIPEKPKVPMPKSSEIAYWTEEKGWSPYSDDEIIKPTNESLTNLAPKREFVVFRGTKEELCKISNGRGFNLYAWHVGLTQDQIVKTKTFLEKFKITGWQAENFWNSVLFYEANVQKKVGRIYSHSCPQK